MVLGKGKGKGKSSKTSSRSSRANLIFPVGRIARMLKQGRYSDRVSWGAPIFLAAVLEYMVSEILELSTLMVEKFKKSRIIPRFIFLGLKEDEDLSRLFKNTIITESGVKPTEIKPNKKEK